MMAAELVEGNFCHAMSTQERKEEEQTPVELRR